MSIQNGVKMENGIFVGFLSEEEDSPCGLHQLGIFEKKILKIIFCFRVLGQIYSILYRQRYLNTF